MSFPTPMIGIMAVLLVTGRALQIWVFIDEKTPASFLEAVEDQMTRPSTEGTTQRFAIVDVKKSDEDMWEAPPEVILDATYQEASANLIQNHCLLFEIPLIVLSPIKETHKRWNIHYAQESIESIVNTLKAIKHYFQFPNVNVFGDISSLSLALGNTFAQDTSGEYDLQIPTADILSFIGRVTRSKGYRVSLFTTTPHTTKEILRAQKVMHVGGVGYANILPLFSTLSNANFTLTGEDLNGCLIVCPQGFELVESESQYYSTILRHIAELVDGLKDSASIKEALEGRNQSSRRSLFSVVNVQDGKRVVVGSVEGGECVISAPIVFLGNSSVPPINTTAAIPLSGNFGNVDPSGLFLQFYLYFWGSTLALKDLNKRRDILEGFSLDLWNFTAGFLFADFQYLAQSVLPHRDKFGAAIIETIAATHISTFVPFLRLNKIMTPVIGSYVTHPILSSRTAFPNFLRLSASDEFLNIVTVQAFSHLGWKKFGLVAANNSFDAVIREKMRNLASQSGLEIVNSQGCQALNYTATYEEATKLYTPCLKEFVESRARVLLIASTQLAIFIPFVLYDLGMRRGDVILITRGWLISDIYSYIDPRYAYKAAELFTGALEFAPDHFVGPLGEKVAKDFKTTFNADPSVYSCLYYDSTLTVAYALDWLILTGQDYMNSTAMMSALRTSRFKGCSGTVVFESNTNDRTPTRFVLQSLKTENGTSTLVEVGKYDPQGVTLLSLNESFQWGTGSKSVPSDTRESTLGCPFEDRLITDFPQGRYLLYGVCSALTLLAVASAAWVWRTCEELTKLKVRAEMQGSDLLVMLGVIVDAVQGIALGPALSESLAPLYTAIALSTWSISLKSGVFRKSLIIAECIIAFWIIDKVYIRIRGQHTHSLFRQVMQVLNHSIESWLLLPLVSILLKSFSCVNGVMDYEEEPGFQQSYLKADCTVSCWKGWHILYSAAAALTLCIYIPGAIFFNSRWQETATHLNVKSSRKHLAVKAAHQVVLISLSEVLRREYPLAYSISFLCIETSYFCFALCVRCYGYRRTVLWHLVSIVAVLWSSLVTVVQTAVRKSPMDIVYTPLVCVGWGVVMLSGLAIQRLKVPSLLYRPRGVDTLYLFKFAFQPSRDAIIQRLEEEFSRTGQSRRVSFAIPRRLSNLGANKSIPYHSSRD